MIEQFGEEECLNTLSKYFGLLSSTGYAGHGLVKRLLAYIFFIDILKYTHSFFTEQDYREIEKVFNSIFAGCGCVLKYPFKLSNGFATGFTLGGSDYMGVVKWRITEVGKIYRTTENDLMRTA